MTSRPSRRASASGSMLAVPQSTVTRSVAPRSRERADRLDIGAVAFENAVRDMHDRIATAKPQEARQQRRGGGAVDVVVAEDRDLLAAQHGVGDACAACSIAVTVCGSGISRRTVGSRNASTSSTSTPRPARMRASNSGTLCRCAIASARAVARSSSRSRQGRPQTERSTSRNKRVAALGGIAKAIVIGTRSELLSNETLYGAPYACAPPGASCPRNSLRNRCAVPENFADTARNRGTGPQPTAR